MIFGACNLQRKGGVNLRIGIFSECYEPILNGVVVSVNTFRQELEKRGHKFFIFTPANYKFRDTSINVFRYPALPWPKDYPLAFPYLAPFKLANIQDLKLDIIHSQHIFTMGRLGLKMGRRLDIPVVHTYHTLITEYAHYVPFIPKKLTQSTIIYLSRRYCNACDQIVTPSSPMKKILRDYGVKTAIEVIPTGVYLENLDNPFHKEVLKTQWQIPEDKKILLYVSRVAKEKNLDFLFQVIKDLAQKRNDFHLLVVGSGPEFKHYQSLVHHMQLDSFVTFTGKQEKEKANRFFGAADIFVFPSVTETQGIVITEAMAAGIPAVAINKMGPTDLIQDSVDGFLTPLKVEDFCDKVEILLDNDTLRKKFARAAKENAQKFSARASADKMEKLYEKVRNYYHTRN